MPVNPNDEITPDTTCTDATNQCQTECIVIKDISDADIGLTLPTRKDHPPADIKVDDIFGPNGIYPKIYEANKTAILEMFQKNRIDSEDIPKYLLQMLDNTTQSAIRFAIESAKLKSETSVMDANIYLAEIKAATAGVQARLEAKKIAYQIEELKAKSHTANAELNLKNIEVCINKSRAKYADDEFKYNTVFKKEQALTQGKEREVKTAQITVTQKDALLRGQQVLTEVEETRRRKAAADVEIKNIEKITQDILFSKANAQLTEQRYKTEIEETKVRAFAVTVKQKEIEVMTADVALKEEQVKTQIEETQLRDYALTAQKAEVAKTKKQIQLYHRQIQGFSDDVRLKLLDTMYKSWTTIFTSTPEIELVPDTLKKAKLVSLYDSLEGHITQVENDINTCSKVDCKFTIS